MARTRDERSEIAGKRFEIARIILDLSYEGLIKDTRWEKIVDYYELKDIRGWKNKGLPIKRLSAVAEFFKVPIYFFKDKRILEADFEKCIELRKIDAEADISFADKNAGATGHSGSQDPNINDRFPHFQVRPADLARVFDSFIKDRTKDFTGRQFVFDKLDAFLGDSDRESGYLIIKGEPGIGKSALMSHLVKSRGYIHHFNIALQAINKPAQFLNNICAQLIAKYELDHPAWPPDADKDGAFLNQLLAEAAEVVAKNPEKEGTTLVIAVDALDEVDATGLQTRANLLFLPPSLPDGVFFVVTSRHKYDLPLYATNKEEISLEAGSEDNREDARKYILARLRDERIRSRITALDVSEEEFVEKMLEKSEANFMYLRHVLPAIRAGKFIDIPLEDLPKGLLEYYRQHWNQMRDHDPDVFDALYQPVVCVLAAVKEAVAENMISCYTELSDPKVRRVIRDWFEFLYEELNEEREKLYRVYHGSFQEFLQEEVDPGLKTYHKMISKYYLGLAGMTL